MWLKKLLSMFPGQSRTVVYLQDSKKKLLAGCLHHAVLLEELRETLARTAWFCGKEEIP